VKLRRIASPEMYIQTRFLFTARLTYPLRRSILR